MKQPCLTICFFFSEFSKFVSLTFLSVKLIFLIILPNKNDQNISNGLNFIALNIGKSLQLKNFCK